MKVIFFVIVWLCLPYSTNVLAAIKPEREIRLGTNMHLADAADSDRDVSQVAAPDQLQCIFERLNQPYAVFTKPWRRAWQEVRKEMLDGFFTALALKNTGQSGVVSEPLVLENWYWFWRTDTPEPQSWRKNYRLGTILGSQQALWLEQENFPKAATANNLPQLIKMLFSGRIDVLLADKDQFEQVIEQMEGDYHYHARFFRYVPLGVYFGNPFLNRYPGFLAAFNEQVHHCLPAGFALSPSERETITTYLASLLAEWGSNEVLTAALLQANKETAELSDEQLQIREEQWQGELGSDYGEAVLIPEVLDREASRQLQKYKQGSAPLITEILLMNNRGVVVAISDATSNFWNQQETKYQSVFGQPAATLVVEPVAYDASTRHFQVQVSTPIYGADPAINIGVLTVGVDVEQALSLDD